MPGKADGAAPWLFDSGSEIDAAESTAGAAWCALTLSGASLGSVSGQDL